MTVLDGDKIIIPHSVWSGVIDELIHEYFIHVDEDKARYIIWLPKDNEKKRDRICGIVHRLLGYEREECDEAISEAAERYRAREYELYLKRKAEKEAAEEQRQKEMRWKLVSENGCGKCPYKREAKESDIGFGRGECACAVTGEVLNEKNFEGWDITTGIYSLFNWRAMPSEKCPYNTDKEAEHDGSFDGQVPGAV